MRPLFAALGAFLLVAVSAYLLWRFFPGHADGQTLAAWIQAIGSIVAILGAFWIGKMQVSDAHRIEKQARQRSILAIAEAAHEHARRIGEAISQAEPGRPLTLYRVYDKTIIDGMVRALTGVPVQEIGSRDGVLALLDLTNQFAFLGIAVESFINRWSDPKFRKPLEQFGPDEREQRQSTADAHEKVLLTNVQLRLDQIRADYVSLRTAIDRDVASDRV